MPRADYGGRGRRHGFASGQASGRGANNDAFPSIAPDGKRLVYARLARRATACGSWMSRPWHRRRSAADTMTFRCGPHAMTWSRSRNWRPSHGPRALSQGQNTIPRRADRAAW